MSKVPSVVDDAMFSALKVSESASVDRVTVQFEKDEEGQGYLIIRDDIHENVIIEIQIDPSSMDDMKSVIEGNLDR